MPREVTVVYKCDLCQNPIEGIYGPLEVSIRGEKEPQVNRDCVFCNFGCLAKWADARK